MFDRDEEGQGLAEYALILALIAIVAIIALIFLGGQVSTILSKVGNRSSRLASSTCEAAGPLGPAASSFTVVGLIAGEITIRTASRLRLEVTARPPGRTLQRHLSARAISCRFFLMVLAHWYSRAACGRC